jgi:hypothetical protein
MKTLGPYVSPRSFRPVPPAARGARAAQPAWAGR